jgi:hypothetical protein
MMIGVPLLIRRDREEATLGRRRGATLGALFVGRADAFHASPKQKGQRGRECKLSRMARARMTKIFLRRRQWNSFAKA